MTSLPAPPNMKSPVPRPRTSSSPSSPARLSYPSVPVSRPPLGQPGRSFVVMTPDHCSNLLNFRVPSHRASSDAVASGVCACSLEASVCPCFSCGASDRNPEQPTINTKHPIRKASTTAIRTRVLWRCPRRTTAHSPLHISSATSASEHATLRSPAHLQGRLIHRSAWKGSSANFACFVLSEVRPYSSRLCSWGGRPPVVRNMRTLGARLLCRPVDSRTPLRRLGRLAGGAA